MRRTPRFWDKWRITVHSDIDAVFDLPPPDSVVDEISADDAFSGEPDSAPVHRAKELRRWDISRPCGTSTEPQQRPERESSDHGSGQGNKTPKALSRRDSIMPFPGLRAELRGLLSESGEVNEISSRLEALEETTSRIEELLLRLTADMSQVDGASVQGRFRGRRSGAGRTGTLADLDQTADVQ